MPFSPAATPDAPRAVAPGGRFFRPRTIWLPTLRGWLVIFAVIAALGLVAVKNAYWFLAASDPVPGGVLVVEGWAAEYAMQAALDEFRRGHYDGFYVTGGPIDDASPLAHFKTCADLGVDVLTRLGLEPGRVRAVPSGRVRQDRTYASAVALREWLRSRRQPVEKLNLVSVGTHSRRSRLLFEKAFPGIRVGVIAVEDHEFDVNRWWASSAGVRSVTSEWIAYFYARLLFRVPAGDATAS